MILLLAHKRVVNGGEVETLVCVGDKLSDANFVEIGIQHLSESSV